MLRAYALAIGIALMALVPASVGANTYQTQEGTPDIQSVGPLAFGEGGILFIADPLSAAVFAVDTKETAGSAENAMLHVKGID